MLNDARGFSKKYIATGYSDLQKGIDGLANVIKFQLCVQLRVCNQVGGNPIYPRSSQPDNSESWDVVGNSN